MVAPSWDGNASPWATISPSASQMELEKSNPVLTMVERAVRLTLTTMLSAIVISPFLISSRRKGSIRMCSLRSGRLPSPTHGR